MEGLLTFAKLLKEMTYEELKTITSEVITEPLHGYLSDLDNDKRDWKENIDFDYFSTLLLEWADTYLESAEIA